MPLSTALNPFEIANLHMFKLLPMGGLLSSTTPFVPCNVWWNSWKSNTGSSISVSRHLENSSGTYMFLSEKRATLYQSLQSILTAWPFFVVSCLVHPSAGFLEKTRTMSSSSTARCFSNSFSCHFFFILFTTVSRKF